MLKRLAVISCLLVWSVTAQQIGDPNTKALEKSYQQVLFEYYQGNFASALTQMAILEQKFPNGLQHIPEFLTGYKVEPELLKGGISLAYGLDNQAADIFLRLLKNNTAADVTAYSWLMLGKTYYQKRQYTDAAQAFQKINHADANEYFELSTRDNWLYMQSQLYGFLLDVGAGNSDIQWLEQLSDTSIYRDYVQYNQALALLQQGENQQAIAGLTTLVNNPSSFSNAWWSWADPLFAANNENSVIAERDAIRDRANLTLGYTLLQSDEPHQAFRVFENIRTQGIDSEAALLGYGWAAAKKGDLQIALAIWQQLIKTPTNSEYTLEAYLASAYAYEKAFAPKQSLQMLKLGLERFKDALAGLNMATHQVNDRQFILDLLPKTPQSQTTDFDVNQSLKSKGTLLNTTQLFNSVAVSNEFRAGLRALQQSREMQQQLQNWQQRMQHYHLMLDERQAERTKRAKQILQNRTLEQLPPLQKQRDALANLITTAINEQDGQIFMGQQSQDWLQRVKRSEARLATIAELKQQLGQAPLKDFYQQRLARVSGRLIWQASEASSKNQWQAKKALQQLDTDIANAQQQQQQLRKQLNARPNYAKQRQRVTDLAQRIVIQIANNDGIEDALVAQLSTTFKQFIQAHKQKVQHYILQAQLAMVRLSDQALQQDKDGSELTSDGTDAEDAQL